LETKDGAIFLIGYSILWRIIFGVFGVGMLGISLLLLLNAMSGADADVGLPISMLFASFFMSLYLIPLVTVRQQRLEVMDEGLKIQGDSSAEILPWSSIRQAKFKWVMFLMPYLVISLSEKDQMARFLDHNPNSFLAKWTAHVKVLSRYPAILRWLFSVPKTMTTTAMLEWLERRYGGSIVIDTPSLNGRGRELLSLIQARIGTEADHPRFRA